MNRPNALRTKIYSAINRHVKAISNLAQFLVALSIVFACLALVATAIIARLAISVLDDLLKGMFRYAPRTSGR